MRGAENVIPVFESLVSQMTPVITIDLIEASGSNWKLWSCDTYWTMRDMTITIGGEDFTVVEVSQDEYVIVSGEDEPVGASYQLSAPTAWHGSHRKVNSEMMEEPTPGDAVVYLPVPRVRETNDPEEEVVYTASWRPLFLYTYNQRRDTIGLQQDEVIEPLNAMADFFLWLIEYNDDLYNTPEDIERREWMNFGNEAVWGNESLIFNRDFSGVELSFDLEVLPDGVCACSDVEPQTCAPVPFYLNGDFEEDLTSGEDFRLTVEDDNGDPQGVYDPNTNTIVVPAAGGGGSTPVDVTVNGTLVYDQVTTDQALRVVDSGDNEVGFLDGPNTWLIENSVVSIKDTDNNTLYDVSVAPFGSATQVIDDVTVDNSNVTYTADVLAEGILVLPDTSVQLQVDGVNYGAPVSVVTLDPSAVLNITW
jgi:hypothetical protein